MSKSIGGPSSLFDKLQARGSHSRLLFSFRRVPQRGDSQGSRIVPAIVFPSVDQISPGRIRLLCQISRFTASLLW